jgi:hypothetical protein
LIIADGDRYEQNDFNVKRDSGQMVFHLHPIGGAKKMKSVYFRALVLPGFIKL